MSVSRQVLPYTGPVSEPPDPTLVADLLRTAVQRYDETKERSQQKAAGILGMSDIGFCKAKALLTMAQVTPSDTAVLWWKAVLGTSLGDTVEVAALAMFPDWIRQLHTVATLSVGKHRPAIPGTPDLVVQPWNSVIDNKSKDGLSVYLRHPWTQNYEYQLWLQVLGLRQAGLLRADLPSYMHLAIWDRSGDDERVLFIARKQWDPTLEDEVAFWIDEVIDARLEAGDKDVRNYVEPLQDVTASVCEKVCEQFRNCRGNLPMRESEPITDPETLAALDEYLEGRTMASAGERKRKDARAILKGINGFTESGWTVRTTHVEGSFVEGYETSSHDKVEVVKTRKR